MNITIHLIFSYKLYKHIKNILFTMLEKVYQTIYSIQFDMVFTIKFIFLYFSLYQNIFFISMKKIDYFDE